MRAKVRYLAILVTLAVLATIAVGQAREDYIAKYSAIAVQQMKEHGIPASITLAQGCLESAFGSSYLAVNGNNHFGIKCHNWKGKTISKDGDCYRKYGSAEDSYRDHSEFLRYNRRYASLFELDPTDYKGWAHGLRKAGYAEDPAYPQKLISLIERYGLQRFDGVPQVAELPPAPAEIEAPQEFTPPKGTLMQKVSLSRKILKKNGVAFIVTDGYETWQLLADEFGLFRRELMRFNDIKTDGPIPEGTVVYIEAKKKQAAKLLDKHVVAAGESVRDIAQQYAVKEKYIRKYNGLPAGAEPQEGDILKLRK